MSGFQEMIERTARPGKLVQILLRPARLATPESVLHTRVEEAGLGGDHGKAGKRAVTLLQAEHLPVIGAMLGEDQVDPMVLRRNLIVAGVNLNALKGRRVEIGSVVLRITGICAPCSRMEKVLGPGGYSAMRGHGGWCAEVLQAGDIAVGQSVTPLTEVVANKT